MKFLKILFGSLLIFLMSCSSGSGGNRDDGYRRTDDEYDQKRDRDSDRDDVIDRSRKRHGGGDCAGDDDCEEICDDIYNRRRDKEDCEKLSSRQVELLLDVYETLERPKEDDLEDIDLDDFDVLVNISIEPLDGIVGKYTRREAKEVLIWLASNEEAAKVFKKEDDDHNILEKIFEEVHNDELEALKASLEGGDNFMDLAVDSSNVEAAEWIHEFMEEKICTGGNIESSACLKKYCELAESMKSDFAEDMLEFEFFEEYLEDIIEEGINGDEWARGHRTTGDEETDPSGE